ncbi:MAG: Ppx/GppA phosphatase family protein [Actinomycetia bacterium]|nr:Ppx/GppA phosphatase family protein [Actinomycetes bacterium]
MRLGVIDVGSNTVHLLIVDAYQGAHPLPASSHKINLRLSEHVTDEGLIADDGRDRLVTFVGECLEVAEHQGAESVVGFATSAIRDAPNGDDVLAAVHAAHDVELDVMAGEEEARHTFLAARRWFGWSSGTLLMIDIGGGSLELAVGMDEDPDVAISLQLGAGRITHDWLPGDPPSAADIRAARKYVRAEIAAAARPILRHQNANRIVGTSKTMRSLARICGAAPSREGPYVTRMLERSRLSEELERIATMTVKQRAGLSGVSAARAPQLLGGAIVAEAAMDLLGVESLEICPWAMREGVILRLLDHLDS